MEIHGVVPPPPPPPPPPQPQSPPLPPLPPGVGAYGVELRISRRLLWVGAAAYPLHNIVRVYTTVLSPDRVRAVVQFLKWAAALAVALYLLAEFIDEGSSSSCDYYGNCEDNTSSEVEALVAFGIAMALFLVAQLVYQVSRPDQHVLAVEVASASVALVTMRDESLLGVVVQHLVHAIDHPEAEFSIRMDRVQVNLKNYHFGDNVNVHGGVGNTGVVRS